MVPSTDSDPDFPDEFCRFLQKCVANVDAAELLLALFNDQQRSWDTNDLRAQLAPVASLHDPDAAGRASTHVEEVVDGPTEPAR